MSFEYKDKFIADYGCRFCVYLGIRPKELQFIPENINQLTKKKHQHLILTSTAKILLSSVTTSGFKSHSVISL